jgi:hypothetical protein
MLPASVQINNAGLRGRTLLIGFARGQYKALVHVFADIDCINLVGRKKSPGIL